MLDDTRVLPPRAARLRGHGPPPQPPSAPLRAARPLTPSLATTPPQPPPLPRAQTAAERPPADQQEAERPPVLTEARLLHGDDVAAVVIAAQAQPAGASREVSAEEMRQRQQQEEVADLRVLGATMVDSALLLCAVVLMVRMGVFCCGAAASNKRTCDLRLVATRGLKRSS